MSAQPQPVERIVVRSSAFADSVALMVASRDASRQPGVALASVAAATPLNLGLLERQGFDLSPAAGAEPSDLVIAIRAVDEEAVDRALEAIEPRVRRGGETGTAAEQPPRTVRSAAGRRPLSLALVSVPGSYAAYECASALEAGLHVFCFSDGVSLEHELALKRRALSRELLMLGPECGTAIVDGVGLGFANAVRRGPIGLVGASGTGLQALTCLLDAAGVGISQAIGVGGRDLLPEIGGLMSVRAIERLAEDPATEVIGLVGKASDPRLATRLASAAGPKPLVLAIPGAASTGSELAGVELLDTLEGAAARLCELVGARPATFAEQLSGQPTTGVIRGLFAGGTLCVEAAAMTAATVGADAVVVGPGADGEVDYPGDRHVFVDFGNHSFTRGRPHPMIDPTLRGVTLEEQAADDDVGALLFDVVLGRGAHPDPASELAPAVERGLAKRSRPLALVVSLCGTEADPQGIAGQSRRLRAAGAIVTRSNTRATRLALAAAVGTEVGA